MKLGQWPLITSLVKEVTEYQDQNEIVECAIDLLLSHGSCPTDVLLGALQIIIKDGVYSQKSSLDTAIKWVRILMSLTLPSREQLCEEAISQLKEGLALRKVS